MEKEYRFGIRYPAETFDIHEDIGSHARVYDAEAVIVRPKRGGS